MSQHPVRSAGPLFLLDGMSLAFRAYFALPADLATSTGVVTNAVHGFISMLVLIVREHRPGSLAVAFDLPGATFREELVEDYKAGRAETPDDLLPQFSMIRRILDALGVPVIGKAGYEADDVLATLATQARDRGCDVVVVTGDRDCFQLVEDPHVRVLYNRRGVSDYTLYDEAGIVERTGVRPALYPMLAALRGDPSDNLPGVPGVGEKTAAKLLTTYGDLDGIFAHLDELSPKLRENLAAHEARVRANHALMQLVRDVPVDVALDQLTLGGWDTASARATFAELELRTLWRRVAGLLDEGSFGPPAPGSEPLDAAAEQATSIAVDGSNRAVGPLLPDPAAGDNPGGVGSAGRMAVEPLPLPMERPASVGEAVTALTGLAPVRSGHVSGATAGASSSDRPALALIGCWTADPGRSPLRGLLLASGSPVAGAQWLEGGLLGEAAVVEAAAALLAEAPVVGHQVKEVLRSLLPLGIDARHVAMDTAVAAYLLDPSSGDYALEALTAGGAAPDRAGGGPGEDEVDSPAPAAAGRPRRQTGGAQQLALDTGAPTGEVADPAVAACAEAATVLALVGPLRSRLEVEGLVSLHDEVEAPLVRVLARMEVAGIRVDTAELRRIADELASDTQALMAEVQRLAGHEFNVNSTPQLRAVLYDELGLTPGRKTKTGYSTDAATLESLRDQHAIVDALLRYRELEKLRSTYGEALLAEVADDGRIHASFRQTVARTGRLSSERPNLHNIPVRTDAGRRFRRAFVPAEGARFLVADYDQIELRVIAHLSGDPGLVGAFTAGTDIHRAVAAGVYGVPVEEVTRTQRERAKMVSYGLAYGMEAFGLARRLSTGVEEAREIIDRYFRAFPEVRAYMDATVAEARLRGFTRTPLGRKRPLPDLAARNRQVRMAAERQAMNAGIQGLAADVFKTALVRLDGAFEQHALTSRLVLQVHDEVIVEASSGEEEQVAELTRQALTGAAELSVPLEVSMSWGNSWAEAKGG
jgi:DNA polymerase-1